MWSILDEHRTYIADAHRLEAFARALRHVVRPTDVVLDLGSGTGVLALLASQASPRHIYSVEATEIVQLARDICRANGCDDRVTFIKEASTSATLPERVDVVVSDQIGGFGFEGGVFGYFRDARRRLLAPGGRFIPSAIELSLAPVDVPDLYETIDVWSRPHAGLVFDPARRLASSVAHPATIEPAQLVGDPLATSWLDPSQPLDAIAIEGSCIASRNGTIHGLAGWFTARLADDVTMTNAPGATYRIARPNTFLPLERPIDVKAGDRIDLGVGVRPDEPMVTWRVDVIGENRRPQRVRQSLFEGLLLSAETLKRTNPSFTPTLTAFGDARREVLTLCDGTHTVEEIEWHVFHSHKSLFESPAQASAFVAKVLAKDA